MLRLRVRCVTVEAKGGEPSFGIHVFVVVRVLVVVSAVVSVVRTIVLVTDMSSVSDTVVTTLVETDMARG